ncbi:MAG TPA: ABC transporter permease DevC [Acidobacteriota bacterium]|nr:ABC transporter permease DevC [Acidobacteriota bacterium]
MGSCSISWRQLLLQKRRLLLALAGVAFSVMLMLMQLGFRQALFDSAGLFYSHLRGEIVLISPQFEYLVYHSTIPRRRLYQALAVDGVDSAAPLTMGVANWKNPVTRVGKSILVFGIDPARNPFDMPEVAENLERVRLPGKCLFDANSRAEFGPVAEMLDGGRAVTTELSGKKIEVSGVYHVGTSFGANGNLILSELSFANLYPDRYPNAIDFGIIRLKAGADVERVCNELAASLPSDVRVLTQAELIRKEQKFWDDNSPIGFIFAMGTLMAVAVGSVVVYQILFADVSEHLADYATLKALGHSGIYLCMIVLEQALILSFSGFVPGVLMAQAIYILAHRATLLPMTMTLPRIAGVLILTVAMCVISGVLALRRLKAADPAEIF